MLHCIQLTSFAVQLQAKGSEIAPVIVGVVVYAYWDREYLGVRTITNATTQDDVLASLMC